MTKIKRNYTANMIMNVWRVCQLYHYFASKQGLAINLPWPALKSKQHWMQIHWTFWHHQLINVYSNLVGIWDNWSTQKIKYNIRWVQGREVGLIKLLYSLSILIFPNFTTFFLFIYLMGGNYLWLSILAFPLSQKAMPISVISPMG